MSYKTIQTNSLEIFKQNEYQLTDIGYVSNNAYLSVVATNNCQCNCPYCINSETDRTLKLPLAKAIRNIRKLMIRYGVREAIILGGEPLIYPRIVDLVSQLKGLGLQAVRLTTNGIRLIKKDGTPDQEFITKLCEAGLDGINISFHNEDFITWSQLEAVYDSFREHGVKVRVNTNIWRGNNDVDYLDFIWKLQNYCDEIRVSNIIPKDDFSVNPSNNDEGQYMILSNEEYETIFNSILDWYNRHTDAAIFENKKTLGFVRYLLIATKKPIIINWNIGSTVSDQVCENSLGEREINTFKCLVTGDISLSWNTNNIIDIVAEEYRDEDL